MNVVASACRRAVLEADPRLVEALYLCQVQAAAEALSGVYAVLGRRRARILQEELREGSGAFVVHAYLPVEGSFGLAHDMRRHTSGAASASLLLSHWERLQVRGSGAAGAGPWCAVRGLGLHTTAPEPTRNAGGPLLCADH
jgi:ribosome assembly protein 1